MNAFILFDRIVLCCVMRKGRFESISGNVWIFDLDNQLINNTSWYLAQTLESLEFFFFDLILGNIFFLLVLYFGPGEPCLGILEMESTWMHTTIFTIER